MTKTIAAIAGITFLNAWALYLGYDGVLFLTAVGIMSGLGGYPIVQELKSRWDMTIFQSYLKARKK